MVKIAVLDNTLLFDAPSPESLCEYPHKPYIARKSAYIFAAYSMGLSSFKLLWLALEDVSFLQ